MAADAANGPAALTKEQLLWAGLHLGRQGGTASCRMPVILLAAIGEVESSSLRGRSLDARHDVVPPVIGVALNGSGFASIRDTDGGRLDGDPVWDRAVGPMQFIPGTWRAWGADGNGDGVADPQNIEDATLTAARYLCAGGKDLSRRSDLDPSRAVLQRLAALPRHGHRPDGPGHVSGRRGTLTRTAPAAIPDARGCQGTARTPTGPLGMGRMPDPFGRG